VEATRSVVDLVRAMHQRIGAGPDLLGRPLEGPLRLLNAIVYGPIRGVTGLVGAGIDGTLALLGPALGASAPGPEREAILAALNGVLGDYLEETKNPLAIKMELRGGTVPRAQRLLVLVHGSSMNDLQWTRQGHDHGEALARDLGLTPSYLRYNSGLHVSTNGRAFAALLEQVEAEEIFILAHSMGGLVARSACHLGGSFLGKLRKLVFLGTPHHGAPLERGGSWVDLLLGVSSYSAPLTRLGRIRSAGVTDLRYGNVRDDDWEGRDRFAHGQDPRIPTPLPAGVACYAAAATTASTETGGDGLVPLASALGRHALSERTLAFPPEHQRIFLETNHLELLSSREVYETLRAWFSEPGWLPRSRV
jgi:pimeloyl-ACP methyl ester carboxylesterase